MLTKNQERKITAAGSVRQASPRDPLRNTAAQLPLLGNHISRDSPGPHVGAGSQKCVTVPLLSLMSSSCPLCHPHSNSTNCPCQHLPRFLGVSSAGSPGQGNTGETATAASAAATQPCSSLCYPQGLTETLVPGPHAYDRHKEPTGCQASGAALADVGTGTEEAH